MPLNQDIEHRHRVVQAHFQVIPDPMGKVLEMTDQGQHRQQGFHQHATIPFTPFAGAQVSGMPIVFHEMDIGKDDHLVRHPVHQALKGTAIIDISGVTVPIDNQAEMVEQHTQLTADNPTLVGPAFTPNLFITASLTTGMQQFDAETVCQTDHRGGGQKRRQPGTMLFQGPKQTGAFGQLGKQMPEVAGEPTVERPCSDPFQRKHYPNRYQFAGVQLGLWVFRHFFHRIIHPAEQFDDKIFIRHGITSFDFWFGDSKSRSFAVTFN